MSPLSRLIAAARSLPTTLGRVETRGYIPELDGLRCLAILFVLVWHASLRASRYIQHVNDAGGAMPNYYGLFPHGEIGVILFFFISGFVVSQPFIGRPVARWRIGDFYKRRFMRIYPPYLIVMATCFLVLGIVGHTPVDANAYAQADVPLRASFLASLGFLHGIVFDAPSRLNPPMWSLEIEVAFYALLPVLMLAYCRWPSRGRRVAAMCAVIVGAILASSLLLHSLDIDLRLRWGLFYHAYLFLAGVVAADLFGTPARETPAKGVAGDIAFGLGLLVIVGIGLMMTQNDARMTGGLYALAIQSLTLLSIALLYRGAVRGRVASAALSLGWVRLIGMMCYSIYLTHIIVMTALSEALGRFVHTHDTPLVYAIYLPVLVSVSLCVGTAFYVAVERPFARRLVGARSKAPGIDLAEAATLRRP